jgi:hypothetical protein
LQSKKDGCNVRAHRSRDASKRREFQPDPVEVQPSPDMKPAFLAIARSETSRFHRDADACALRSDYGKPGLRQNRDTRHD